MEILKALLSDNIQLKASCSSWEEAIKISAQPLLDAGDISSSYLDAMINNIHRLGSYMVLMPGVAMPHARPEDGCHKGSLSLLILETPVIFPDNQSIWFILSLGAHSSDSHIDTIEAIADFLSDEDTLKAIQQADTVEDIKLMIP
ncbi:MAG: PTS sugar transporter subunit IIA [Brevinema sp.]